MLEIHAAPCTLHNIVVFISLHASAGTCILVCSASPIHGPPIQRVLQHCRAHKHQFIYMHMIQNNLSWKYWWGFNFGELAILNKLPN